MAFSIRSSVTRCHPIVSLTHWNVIYYSIPICRRPYRAFTVLTVWLNCNKKAVDVCPKPLMQGLEHELETLCERRMSIWTIRTNLVTFIFRTRMQTLFPQLPNTDQDTPSTPVPPVSVISLKTCPQHTPNQMSFKCRYSQLNFLLFHLIPYNHPPLCGKKSSHQLWLNLSLSP